MKQDLAEQVLKVTLTSYPRPAADYDLRAEWPGSRLGD